MKNNLKDKRILIIGGGSGFGKELALLALKYDANVVITGRSNEKNQAVLQELANDDKLEAVLFEAKDQASFQQLFQKLGTFDHVISMLGGAMGSIRTMEV